jgi:hypothetical protein
MVGLIVGVAASAVDCLHEARLTPHTRTAFHNLRLNPVAQRLSPATMCSSRLHHSLPELSGTDRSVAQNPDTSWQLRRWDNGFRPIDSSVLLTLAM